MNLVQLEYLVETVARGSFSAAGKQLFVTPQAVSRSISRLEREIAAQLFYKKGKSIEATELGILLADRAGEILASVEDLKHIAMRKDENVLEPETVLFGIVEIPYRGRIVNYQTIDLFATAYTNINLISYHVSSGTCVASLEEGIIDCAIILGRHNSKLVTSTKLFSLNLALLVSDANKLAPVNNLYASNLQGVKVAVPSDLRFVYPLILKHFRSRKITPEFIQVPPFLEDHYAFIQSGGVLFVTADCVLQQIYPSSNILYLQKEDEIVVPVCFAKNRTLEKPGMSVLEAYLLRHVAEFKCLDL